MGSLCGSNTTTTTTNQSSTTPANSAGVQDVFNKVQSAASNPYTPYSGELTAPINQQQQLGIAGVNAAANSAQPYYQTAADYARTSGAAIDPSQIARYSNPYTQSVINATQANFNESNGQQQQQVKGNAALSGALGGDRQAVAQAETARQQKLAQDPVIAGLNQSNYTQALQAAQADRSAAGNAAGTFGSLGTAAQTAGLQGAGAQINAGTLQQGTQQAQDTAKYQQYLQAQGFPYQQAQFFAQYGLPAATAAGSSTSGTGTSTPPAQNPWSQIAGLGIAGAGLFLKDGGAVDGFAAGGSPYSFITDAPSFIPSGGNAPQVSMPHSAAPMQMSAPASATQADPWAAPIAQLGKLKGNWAGEEYGGGNALTSAYGGSSSDPLPGLDASDYGAGFNVGGLVHAIHHIHKSIKHSRGGSVGGSPFQSFAKGGNVRRFADGGDVFGDDNRAIAYDLLRKQAGTQAPDSIPGGEPVINPDEPYRMPPPEAVDAWRRGVNNPALVADAGSPPPSPQAAPAPANPMRLPPQITGSQQEEEGPSNALAYDTPAKNPMTTLSPPAEAAPEQHFGKSLFGANISDKTRQALVAAGLGMMASKSPSFLGGIGEGGLHGLKSYTDATTAEREAADKKISQAQQQKRIDFEAQRIAQSASQFAKTSSQAERRLKLAEDKVPEGYRATKDGSYEPIPGGPADPEMLRKVAEAKRAPGQVMDDETAGFLADRVVAGDTRALVGLGRGAQGAENIAKIQSLAVQKAKEQGLDAKGILRNISEQAYNMSGARALGTKTIHFGTAEKAMEESLPIARAASAEVPRTQWKMLTELIQKGQTQVNDPKLKKFLIATDTAAKDYARTINPTGTLRESDIAYARKILSTADSEEAYNAGLDQLQVEAGVMKRALARQKEEMLSGGKGGHAAPATAAPGPTAAPTTPAGVPPGSAYSPSRKQWKAPDGTIYNADGSKT